MEKEILNSKEEHSRKPHRQICQLCHKVCRVGFWVPDDIWELAVHESQLHTPMCLQCFTRMADERYVPWDKEIEFHPESRYTHDSNFQPNHE